ncbi:MAG: FtsX-like permease family protein, partial [Alphaproteobacteria bacterium]
AAIGQIDGNLRAAILRDLPERAPSFFMIDIQPGQLDRFLAIARAQPGVERVETAPMLRGVITRINGRPATEVAGDHWVVRGDRGVSFAAAPPPGTRITAGRWWPPDWRGEPQMSFAEEEAREIGLRLGDTVTVNILGRDITYRVTSFREVDFSSAGIGFVMVVDPASVAGAPHSSIATVYARPEAEAPLLRALAAEMPNVTAIRVREVISRAAELFGLLAAATRWAAAATLVTGIAVLVGTAAAAVRARAYEAAVLKTLGASRGQVLASLLAGWLLLGLAAAAVALVAGAGGAWAVLHFVMDVPYRFAAPAALGVLALGLAATLGAGAAFAREPLRVRPARLLRARE